MDLPTKRKAHSAQFITKAFLIRRFQQTRSQVPVYLNRSRNDATSNFVEITEPLCSLCVLRSCVALHFSSLRLSLRSLRLCDEFTSSLFPRRRLPLQYLFQHIFH